MKFIILSALTVFALLNQAHAQETIDVGALQNKDFKVVQKQLYDKENLREVAIHGGVMPFDAFSVTPKLDVTYANYLSESMAWEVAVGAGYGFKNSNFKQLEGPAYGIEPDVYRYLTSVIGDIQWAPIYAKMAMNGQNIFHYDVYGIGGGGLTLEQSIIPSEESNGLDLSLSPTATLGVGSRIFLANGSTVRVQLRDDFLLQRREKTKDTQAFYLKQNITISVGYTFDLRKIADDAKDAVQGLTNKEG